MESKRRTLEPASDLGAIAGVEKVGAKFGSVRRVFGILDLVSREENPTAKLLAREIGVSLSTCYCLIDILIEEGYLEKVSPREGYRLGAAVSKLHERRSGSELIRNPVEEYLNVMPTGGRQW